jgi:hypothetical protein
MLGTIVTGLALRRPAIAGTRDQCGGLIGMYYEIAEPYALLFNLAAEMKQDSAVGIVDLDRPTGEYGTQTDLLRRQLATVSNREAGYRSSGVA